MFQSVIRQGPDRAAETIVDRTLILDPAALWPDPLSCPDWPVEIGGRRYEGLRGRKGAKARLEMLSQHLNRGAGKVRPPSKDEREELSAKMFLQSGTEWHHLGIRGLSSRDRTVERDAHVIVDAVHVRGYLRKLDAQEKAQAEADERQKIAQARRRLDGYNQSVTDGRAELTALAEAEARHRQRIEDEQAFNRCHAIRQNLRHGHYDATQAAAKLGVEAPPMPTFF